MKLRLPSWLTDCGASIALLALAVLLVAPPPATTAPPGGTAYLSSADAAEDDWAAKFAKQRLIRAEVMRGLRSGRSAADRPSASVWGLLSSPARRAPSSGLAAPGAASEDALALATAHRRPAPRGPPRLG